MTDKKIIEILWTGGFDSTFRVVQLSKLPVKIQPYYIRDNRISENMELDAIEKISKSLRQKPETKCELLPLIKIQMNERIISEEITNAYLRIKKQRHLGSQYDYMGRFASAHPGIELGVLMGDHWKEMINKFGKVILKSDKDIGDYYVVDTDHSPEDLNILFQHYHFPLAAMTKLDLKQKYIEWGYEDIMKLTWFCHTPIKGEPCGKCIPCNLAIEAGLKERFSNTALRRYWLHKYISPIKKIKSRFFKKIDHKRADIKNMTIKPHIALVLSSLEIGGTQRVMMHLADGLLKEGFIVDVVAVKAQGPFLKIVPAEANLVDLGAKRALTAIPAITRYLRKNHPDAVLSGLPHVNIAVIISRFFSGISTRLVVSERNNLTQKKIHSPKLWDSFLYAIVSFFYPFADAVITVSKDVADDLAQSTKLDPKKIIPIYNPIPVDEVRNYSKVEITHPWFSDDKVPVILAVGRLHQQKDYPTLIKAFNLLRQRKPAHLMIIGEGEERLAIEKIIDESPHSG